MVESGLAFDRLERVCQISRWFCGDSAVAVLAGAVDVDCDGDACPDQTEECKDRYNEKDAHRCYPRIAKRELLRAAVFLLRSGIDKYGSTLRIDRSYPHFVGDTEMSHCCRIAYRFY
jgi:hypothetical protein